MELNVIILAAGAGQRMRSNVPKVLHKLAGVTLIERVLQRVQELEPEKVFVVYGHQGEEVRAHLKEHPVNWVLQAEQLGTGHAVKQVLPYLQDSSLALILFADVPLISSVTLNSLLESTPKNGIGLLVAEVENPFGLGRIIRNKAGDILAIVEERDATPEQRKITEIFTGTMTAPVKKLRGWLDKLDNNNAQGEYYLTDVPSLAIAEGFRVTRVPAATNEEVQGINTKTQLAHLERYYQRAMADRLLEEGTTLMDPARFDVRGELVVGHDVSFDVNVICEGKVKIGNNCQIGANTILRNAVIADNVIVKEHCIIEDSLIGNDCIVGPFARLRPGTQMETGARVGNFVEVKKSQIGEESKVNHLSYIGDTQIGKRVNIGAGTITCNYDGVNKHQTVIGDDCFIGSGTELVAPVIVGNGATVGAGSTITKDVAPGKLSLSRPKQCTVPGWQSPREKQEAGE